MRTTFVWNGCTYINRGGNFGTNIDTSASCVSKSQLPPRPYLPSSASNSDGMMREKLESLSPLPNISHLQITNKYFSNKSVKQKQ